MLAQDVSSKPVHTWFLFSNLFLLFYAKYVLNISVLVKAFMYVQNQKTIGR